MEDVMKKYKEDWKEQEKGFDPIWDGSGASFRFNPAYDEQKFAALEMPAIPRKFLVWSNDFDRQKERAEVFKSFLELVFSENGRNYFPDHHRQIIKKIIPNKLKKDVFMQWLTGNNTMLCTQEQQWAADFYLRKAQENRNAYDSQPPRPSFWEQFRACFSFGGNRDGEDAEDDEQQRLVVLVEDEQPTQPSVLRVGNAKEATGVDSSKGTVVGQDNKAPDAAKVEIILHQSPSVLNRTEVMEAIDF
jgi:hypothetical protein